MPAYNEEGIADFVREIATHLGPEVEHLGFVVVDDCSPVHSAVEALRGIDIPRTTVLENDVNIGHGPTVLRGYRQALAQEPDVVIGVDGDGQFCGADFVPLLRELAHQDVVVACRRGRTDPWYRRLLTAALTLVLRPWTSGVRDTNSPLRAYRRTALAQLLDAVDVHSTVPHLQMSLAFNSLPMRVGTIEVRPRERLGASASGTTWGSPRRFVPPRSLVNFCARAVRELAEGRSTRLARSSSVVVDETSSTNSAA